MADSVNESTVGFRVDSSFSKFSSSNVSDDLVYDYVAQFCEAAPEKLVTDLGRSLLRWMFLHAQYRLGFGKSFLLDVPSQFLSLAGGLIVFLSVYFTTHKLSGDAMLAACDAWLATIRNANQEANRIRAESLRKN